MRKPCKCTFVKKIKSLPSSIRNDVLNLIFLDDSFESWVYTTDQDESDLEILQSLHFKYKTGREQMLLLVMTMDSATWEIYKSTLEKLNVFKNVMDISNFEDGEKDEACEEILQANGVQVVEKAEEDNFYCEDFTRDVNIKPKLHKSKIPLLVSHWGRKGFLTLGFPLTCYIFCTSRYLLQKQMPFFLEPLKSLEGEFKRMRESDEEEDTKHYLLLIYTLLCGALDLDSTNESLIERLQNDITPNLGQNEAEQSTKKIFSFKESLTLCRTSNYLRKTGERTYAFTHEIVLIALLKDFGSWKTAFFLQHCNIDFLLKYVRVDDDDEVSRESPFREKTLLLRTNFFKYWIHRLLGMEENIVKSHITFQSRRLQQKYELAVEKYSTKSTKSSDLGKADTAENNLKETESP